MSQIAQVQISESHERRRATPSGKLALPVYDPKAMTLEAPRLKREYETMQRMVEIHCADHHATTTGPCENCRVFLDYAERRLEKCPYGADKPVCAKCPIHCYKRAQREQARTIMRYAGPRMAWRHPWLSLTHVLDKLRRVDHPMVARRRERD